MAEPLWLIGLELGAVVVLVLLNGFFVAAEFAIVKVRTTQLTPRAKGGDPRAKVAHHVTSHLDAYLSACQLGITMASLALGWIGEPAVAGLIEPVLASVGIGDPVVVHTLAFVLAFSLITFLHIVFGELAPKSIAIRHAEDASLALSRPLHWFYIVFKPVIVGLNGFANRMLALVGFEPAASTEAGHTEAELREILAETARGAGGTQRTRLLLNLIDLRGLKVGDIMTPVSRVVFLDAGKGLDENIRIADDSGFSRFPLIEGSPDHVLGLVHYKDIFSRVVRKDRPEQTLRDIRRDVVTAPETQPAETLMAQFLAKAQHMAVVVDEYGRTVGLITLEDIFEEVFGNIRDEFDEPEHAYKQLTEGVYLVDGTTSLHDLEPLLGRDLKKPGVTTLSGYIIDAMGRIPAGGETLRIDGWEVSVREVGRRRVKTVELRRPSSQAATGTPPQIRAGDIVPPRGEE